MLSIKEAISRARKSGYDIPNGTIGVRSLHQRFMPTSKGSLKQLLTKMYSGKFAPIIFKAPILTSGLAALGGEVEVVINNDGSLRWKGYAKNTGFDGYDFHVSALIRPSSGVPIAFAHSGHIPATIPIVGDDIVRPWEESRPPSFPIVNSLSAYRNAHFETHLEYSSDIGSTFESLTNWLIKFSVGTLLSPVGVIVFVGVEIGSLISTGSLVPGARVIEGVLWMAGPSNTLLAIAAAGIASAGSRTRPLRKTEYDWANAEVFGGALPPINKIVLTDTIGGGGRAFTFPRFDGKITLNMGADSFEDPRKHGQRKWGEVFIHELVHACQIHYSKMDTVLLADALASKVCEASHGEHAPYMYGLAGPAYSDFNLEQQAKIVSDWFAGNQPSGTNHTKKAKDINSPYFRYIHENVRLGRF